MKTRRFGRAAAVAAAALGLLTAVAEDVAKEFPISEKLRGHELTEWSSYNAAAMIYNARPRVFLVGDSITGQYQSRVSKLLQGKAYMSYWASSYCVTSPIYMRLLEAFLDDPTKPYDVIHFNNGLHSLQTPAEAYEKRYREAIALIRRKAPSAKVIVCLSTPLKDAPEKEARVRQLNEIAKKIAKENGLEIDDLFGLLDPLDRAQYWGDTCHHKDPAKDLEAKQVAEKVLGALNQRN